MFQSTSLTPLERVRKSHVAIMNHKKWCGFGPLLACGNVSVRTDCKTAYTDGWNVVYGEAFIAAMPYEKLRGVVVHEAFHKAYRHMHIYKNLWERDRRLANVAMDHFVNLAIEDFDAGEGFVQLPECGIKPDPRFRGMSSEQIFNILCKEQEEQGGDQCDSEGMDEHGWEEAQEAGDDAEQTEQREREIKRALQQGEHIRQQRSKGNGNGDSNGAFGDLLSPKVDWRVALRQFVSATCAERTSSTWRKPNRRYLAESDTYMPSLEGKTVKHLLIGFDTSGSCFGTEEMTRFVTELQEIVRSVKPRLVTVAYCDSAVRATVQFKTGKFDLADVKPKGGGGTDLTKIFGWATENRVEPDAAVILTDGETPYGRAPGYPVLWAMTTNVTAPYGTSLRIS